MDWELMALLLPLYASLALALYAMSSKERAWVRASCVAILLNVGILFATTIVFSSHGVGPTSLLAFPLYADAIVLFSPIAVAARKYTIGAPEDGEKAEGFFTVHGPAGCSLNWVTLYVRPVEIEYDDSVPVDFKSRFSAHIAGPAVLLVQSRYEELFRKAITPAFFGDRVVLVETEPNTVLKKFPIRGTWALIEYRGKKYAVILRNDSVFITRDPNALELLRNGIVPSLV